LEMTKVHVVASLVLLTLFFSNVNVNAERTVAGFGVYYDSFSDMAAVINDYNGALLGIEFQDKVFNLTIVGQCLSDGDNAVPETPGDLLLDLRWYVIDNLNQVYDEVSNTVTVPVPDETVQTVRFFDVVPAFTFAPSSPSFPVWVWITLKHSEESTVVFGSSNNFQLAAVMQVHD